ncbi:MAG: hypothetical protein IPK50_17405 [Fibrobacterota bacterium]|nr:hypothetical protein [Fibrobacterota bacterium]QQS04053.1 MAG: hypothetical protein IPK50_17405 [Fibrobacterota bacterium]
MRNATFFSPFLALLVPFTAFAAKAQPSDSALADGDLGGVAILDDAPYENVENPGAPQKAGWKLFTGYSGSDGANADVYTGLWTTSVAKSWYFPTLTPSLKASWSNSDFGEIGSNAGTFTAGLNWAPFEPGAFYLQGAWTTQDGPDEPSATLGTWWDLPLGELVSVGVDGSGGWSQSADFDGHVGASLYAEGEHLLLDLAGGWDYRKIDFAAVTGVSSVDYQNVWSAEAGTRFLWGNWSTGPSYSVEYWKAKVLAQNTTTVTPVATAPRSRNRGQQGSGNPGGTGSNSVTSLVPADGVSLTQVISWNLGWTPLRGWSMDLSGFRSIGQANLYTKQSDPSVQPKRANVVKTTQTEFTPPEDSWGGNVSLSIGW